MISEQPVNTGYPSRSDIRADEEAATEPHVLVINSGSSSIKYQLVEPNSGAVAASGLVERIGEGDGIITHRVADDETESRGPIPDHGAGLRRVFEMFVESGLDLTSGALVGAVGHRVVHGGECSTGRPSSTTTWCAPSANCPPLAPLHNPPNLDRYRERRARCCPECRTSPCSTRRSSTTLPVAARTTRSTRRSPRAHGVRRYGFHGTSHEYVSGRVARVSRPGAGRAQPDRAAPRQRRSASAIRGGRRSTPRWGSRRSRGW